MQLQLLQGTFSASEAIALLSKIVQVNIRFHEAKISNTDLEEDIAMRERHIAELEQSLWHIRRSMRQPNTVVQQSTDVHLAAS
ncbi:MAG: hypothetical protein MUF62_14415 [Chitinophagaceae bacterium]|jgi:hypothetical protein|nr:hypothetical protein [Chitinophagaceae bacterium]